MTLGGTMFVRDGIRFDYCFREAVQSLLELCDKVVVVDAGSTDGTDQVLWEMARDNDKLEVYLLGGEEWDVIPGKEKLVYFTDKAISLLKTDWNFYLQADEIVSEKSYQWIRKAIEENEEGFLCGRVNLWQSPFTKLIVPQNRMPCSPVVLRLAQTRFKSYGDAESLQTNTCSDRYVDLIKIYHMGFVRKREVMRDKIINMQQKVFGMENYDHKLDLAGGKFEPKLWFSDQELEPIKEPLPKIIQRWALERI